MQCSLLAAFVFDECCFDVYRVIQWPWWMTCDAVCWLRLCLVDVIWCHNNPGGWHSVQSVGCLCVWWVLLWCQQSSTVTLVALPLCFLFFYVKMTQVDDMYWCSAVCRLPLCLMDVILMSHWPWCQTSIAACRLPLCLNDVTLMFWCLQSNTKVLVAGPWCNVTAVYTCVFDDKHVAATLIQPGVLRCFTPGNGGLLDGSQPVFWLDK